VGRALDGRLQLRLKLRLQLCTTARCRCFGYMVGVERRVAREHGPQDAGILVGQGDDGHLPTRSLLELYQPLADAVAAFAGRHDRGLGPLDQQGAQVVVPSPGDAPEAGLAAGGVLARHQAQPGAELACMGELRVTDRRAGPVRDGAASAWGEWPGVGLTMCTTAVIH
jgi:hypothetical protein